MVQAIEQTIKNCRQCGKKTIHIRSINQTSIFMALVHLVLTVISCGVWLVLLIAWVLINKKIGGWACNECNHGMSIEYGRTILRPIKYTIAFMLILFNLGLVVATSGLWLIPVLIVFLLRGKIKSLFSRITKPSNDTIPEVDKRD